MHKVLVSCGFIAVLLILIVAWEEVCPNHQEATEFLHDVMSFIPPAFPTVDPPTETPGTATIFGHL